jgi:predicted RNase H-like HicB family nuclease
MKFEVEVYKKETGEWVATAVEHEVSVTGLSEQEVLMRLLEALGKHFKSQRA